VVCLLFCVEPAWHIELHLLGHSFFGIRLTCHDDVVEPVFLNAKIDKLLFTGALKIKLQPNNGRMSILIIFAEVDFYTDAFCIFGGEALSFKVLGSRFSFWFLDIKDLRLISKECDPLDNFMEVWLQPGTVRSQFNEGCPGIFE
jgi:hypothetical protein